MVITYILDFLNTVVTEQSKSKFWTNKHSLRVDNYRFRTQFVMLVFSGTEPEIVSDTVIIVFRCETFVLEVL